MDFRSFLAMVGGLLIASMLMDAVVIVAIISRAAEEGSQATVPAALLIAVFVVNAIVMAAAFAGILKMQIRLSARRPQ